MKKTLLIACILLFGISAGAQNSKRALINDYSMLGVNYGVSFSNMYFSPSKYNLSPVFSTDYVSITYTKHSKMFGSIPNFALVLGLATGTEGFSFSENPETGYTDNYDDVQQCRIRVIEAPAMMQFHADADPFKFMANAGVYGGWRQSISRSGPQLSKEWTDSFRDYEKRLDYGFQGGLGFALVFAPVELHFNCTVRWSWSSLNEPDYDSKYYYKYAYPLDIMATAGLHFHLTKRRGKTNRELKKEAYEIVYGKKN